MKDSEIAALARGLVPFVRQVVSEIPVPPPPLPPVEINKAMLPPELAEKVAGAVRMLHELP